MIKMDKIANYTIENLQIRCFYNEENSGDIIYLNTDFEGVESALSELENMLKKCSKNVILPVFAAIEGERWGHDLSPWPAPGVFRDAGDFTGGAPEYLKKLIEDVMPVVEQTLFGPKNELRRGILGYSLGGLFAFWSLFACNAFDCAASVSGSLWYDGFVEYARSTAFQKKPIAVYLSVGDQEHKTRNKRMAAVERCLEECRVLCNERDIPVLSERNPGNHFVNVPVRIAKALYYLTEQLQQ